MSSIHQYFGLSYAEYLVIPRSVLQSMPEEWGERFVKCLLELNETIDYGPKNLDMDYMVQLYMVDHDADEDSPYWLGVVDDPFEDYERGRRRIPFRSEVK